MKTIETNFEYLKVKVDLIADARGIIFSDKLKFVQKALESLSIGEVLCIYCSDLQHKHEIPNWVNQKGHQFLGIVEETHFFKILIKKNDTFKINYS